MTFLEYIQDLHRNKRFYGHKNKTIANLVESWKNYIKTD